MRALEEIVSAYRAIKRENKMGREEYQAFLRNPHFDADVEAEVEEMRRWGTGSPEKLEEHKLKRQWWRLRDAANIREVEAFASFSSRKNLQPD